MKIRTNIVAGMTFAECDAQRNWWKQQAQLMEQYSNNVKAGSPAGLWLPSSGGTVYPPSSSSGGYVNGVYFPDQSGVCGGTVYPPSTPPSTTGGGYVGGVYYPDKSGVCG